MFVMYSSTSSVVWFNSSTYIITLDSFSNKISASSSCSLASVISAAASFMVVSHTFCAFSLASSHIALRHRDIILGRLFPVCRINVLGGDLDVHQLEGGGDGIGSSPTMPSEVLFDVKCPLSCLFIEAISFLAGT